MSKPSKNIPMPIRIRMRRWNGPIGSRSSRPPALTDVAMCAFPLIVCSLKMAAGLVLAPASAGYCGLNSIGSIQAPLRCGVAVPIERLIVGRDHHALGVEMIVKTFGAAFAADAGIVDAAPG